MACRPGWFPGARLTQKVVGGGSAGVCALTPRVSLFGVRRRVFGPLVPGLGALFWGLWARVVQLAPAVVSI